MQTNQKNLGHLSSQVMRRSLLKRVALGLAGSAVIPNSRVLGQVGSTEASGSYSDLLHQTCSVAGLPAPTAFASGFNLAEVELTLTLSKLAYAAQSPKPGETVEQQEARMQAAIDGGLDSTKYGTWRVVWGPKLSPDRGNMLFIAADSSSNLNAVVVRGTDATFWLDWIEDLGSLLPLVPYPGMPRSSAIQIAAGTYAGLEVILRSGVLSFISEASSDSSFFVTGHSLGGCLASALAPLVATTLGSAERTKVYTYAAPSAGNSGFADYYNQLFLNPDTQASMAFRIYNDLDVVPKAWASLPTIETYYKDFVPCPPDLKSVIEWASKKVLGLYEQVGFASNDSAHILHGYILGGSIDEPDWEPCSDELFLEQAEHQHLCPTYFKLLGFNHFTPAAVLIKRLTKLIGR